MPMLMSYGALYSYMVNESTEKLKERLIISFNTPRELQVINDILKEREENERK